MKTLSWDKIQQGDEEAFRQLYEQYADLLYGYGMKIAGDETLVTEAIQSLFVYIFEKRETCTAPQSIPAYLCVSLRHMIVNELKKENSGSLKSLDEVGTNEEQLEVLQKELNNLTKQQREVLYLKYYKKMSPEEIAQVMGLTSRTVYNTTHMAISSLRERMSKSFLLLVAANLWIFN